MELPEEEELAEAMQEIKKRRFKVSIDGLDFVQIVGALYVVLKHPDLPEATKAAIRGFCLNAKDVMKGEPAIVQLLEAYESLGSEMGWSLDTGDQIN